MQLTCLDALPASLQGSSTELELIQFAFRPTISEIPSLYKLWKNCAETMNRSCCIALEGVRQEVVLMDVISNAY